jgi:3'-phosphoadenosine 5'-phosphosulfate sulfotransferase (PAPS reductase)/FAD synthetase
MSYRSDGPTLVSFSGGRTSAYMLHEVIAAHGGKLPDDVIVGFANTGKERSETLDFVHECGVRWNVPVRWVEWRDNDQKFEEVSYGSASRNGEPFAALIARKQRLPNGYERWCTQYLKVKTLFALMRAEMGLEPGQYIEMIGLRDDEGLRILKSMENNEREGRRTVYPLAKAKIRKADVMRFWSERAFDLRLRPHEGNCDLCFLKGRAIRKRIIRDNPGVAAWWAYQEAERHGRFNQRDSVAKLALEVAAAPELPLFEEDEEADVECGLACGHP